MTVTITQLRNVFKQNAMDSVDFTIWRDPDTLEFKTDDKADTIIGVIPDSYLGNSTYKQYEGVPNVLIIPTNTLYAVGSKVKKLMGPFRGRSCINLKKQILQQTGQFLISST